MRTRTISAVAITALTVVLIATADLLFPPPLKNAEDLSPLVLDRDGQWLHAFANEEKRWRFAADLDGVDPVFIERLIAVEDKRFWSHPGVDPAAVLRSEVDVFAPCALGGVLHELSVPRLQCRIVAPVANNALAAPGIARSLQARDVLCLPEYVINAGALIGGALVVETYFRIPGVGLAIVEAVLREDFPVVLALVMVITVAFVVLNFLVDVLYTFLDPRVRP